MTVDAQHFSWHVHQALELAASPFGSILETLPLYPVGQARKPIQHLQFLWGGTIYSSASCYICTRTLPHSGNECKGQFSISIHLELCWLHTWQDSNFLKWILHVAYIALMLAGPKCLKWFLHEGQNHSNPCPRLIADGVASWKLQVHTRLFFCLSQEL